MLTLAFTIFGAFCFALGLSLKLTWAYGRGYAHGCADTAADAAMTPESAMTIESIREAE